MSTAFIQLIIRTKILEMPLSTPFPGIPLNNQFDPDYTFEISSLKKPRINSLSVKFSLVRTLLTDQNLNVSDRSDFCLSILIVKYTEVFKIKVFVIQDFSRVHRIEIILFSDTLQVPTKETACKTVNDQPTVKDKKFQKEMFQNVSRTVGINAQKTEKKKSVKVS